MKNEWKMEIKFVKIKRKQRKYYLKSLNELTYEKKEDDKEIVVRKLGHLW